jgi:hypothetical protein
VDGDEVASVVGALREATVAQVALERALAGVYALVSYRVLGRGRHVAADGAEAHGQPVGPLAAHYARRQADQALR